MERDRLRITVDLDGTIFEEKTPEEKHLAKPLPLAVVAVKVFTDMGHEITIYTSRPEEMRGLTEKQLMHAGIRLDSVELVMGKPKWDIIIDDRAVRLRDWVTDFPAVLGAIHERMNTPRGL